LSVDSVSRDSHQVTLGSHDVTEQAEMTVVDVQAVEIQNRGNLFLYTLPDSLDTETGEDFADVVGASSHRVYVPLREYLHKCGSVSLKQPFGDGLELSLVRHKDPLLVISLGQMHVHLRNGFQSLKCHVRQQVRLDTPEEHVIRHLVCLIFIVVLSFLTVHEPDPENQFFCVVIVKNAIQIITKSCVDLF